MINGYIDINTRTGTLDANVNSCAKETIVFNVSFDAGLTVAILDVEGKTLALSTIEDATSNSVTINTMTVQAYEHTHELGAGQSLPIVIAIGDSNHLQALVTGRMQYNSLYDKAPPEDLAPEYPTSEELKALLAEMQTASNSAAQSATDARKSAEEAGESASEAAASADSASSALSASTNAANRAEVAAANAHAADISSANSAAAAEIAKADAHEAAAQAASRATEAKAAAASSAASATAAADSAKDAGNSAVHAKDCERAAEAAQGKAEAAQRAAQAAATSAGESARAASASEQAALTAKQAAETAQVQAKSSETAAKASETAAKGAEKAASASEQAAKASEQAAGESATAASASANAAKASETAAANSSTAAASSATAAEAAKAGADAAQSAAEAAARNAATSYADTAAIMKNQEYLEIPNMSSLPSYALAGNTLVKRIRQIGVPQANLASYLMACCFNLEEFNVINDIWYWGEGVFSNCWKLKTITSKLKSLQICSKSLFDRCYELSPAYVASLCNKFTTNFNQYCCRDLGKNLAEAEPFDLGVSKTRIFEVESLYGAKLSYFRAKIGKGDVDFFLGNNTTLKEIDLTFSSSATVVWPDFFYEARGLEKVTFRTSEATSLGWIGELFASSSHNGFNSSVVDIYFPDLTQEVAESHFREVGMGATSSKYHFRYSDTPEGEYITYA